jgi:SOS-response transcriptional repressor LexA
LATTLKQSELVHIHELLKAVQTENPPSTPESEEISNHAIDYILQQACTELENREILRVPPHEKGNTIDIIDMLSRRIFYLARKFDFQEQRRRMKSSMSRMIIFLLKEQGFKLVVLISFCRLSSE